MTKRTFAGAENALQASITELSALLNKDYATKYQLTTVEGNLSSELQQSYTTITSTKKVGMEIHSRIQDLLRQLEDDQSTFAELRAQLRGMDGRINHKAELKAFLKLQDEQSRFALYDDLKELHNKVLPPMKIV